MKNPFAEINWSQLSLPRLLLVALIGLLGLTLVFTLLSSLLGQVTGTQNNTKSVAQYGGGSAGMVAPSMAPSPTDGMDLVYEQRVVSDIAPMPPIYGEVGGVGGYNEADFEAISYNAQYKTSHLDALCDSVEQLKPLSTVVFEQQSRNDTRCFYSFKVARSYADTVATWLEEQDPDEFTVSSEVIKKQLVRYTSQLDILLEKQAAVEKLMDDANAAYEELVVLATRAEAVTALTNALDNQMKQIERLTNERISLAQQIDALSKRQADLSDRVDFVSFTVSVEKYMLLDGTRLKDSWVYELRQFVVNVNTMAQALTIHLLENLLALAQLVLYGVILIVLIKYGWRAGKRFWQQP